MQVVGVKRAMMQRLGSDAVRKPKEKDEHLELQLL